eukprot:jgi/Psemu1/317814/estExt_fgenesh1_pm.C_280027
MRNLDHAVNRNLYDAEDYDSYLVDSQGNQYEPYSMSWRYLGAYIDCDIQQQGGDDVDESNIYRKLTRQLFGSTTEPSSKRRDLGSGSGDGDDCSRKVLWAAYHDPRYRGNEIGEYQFYDHITSTWDQSTCQTNRCAKMNCHASNSHFQLIGVFKEADGFTDWAEQLFKHEGYCVWDGDKDGDGSGSGDGNDGSSDYEFMSNRQDYIAQSCDQMYLADDDGNTVYRGLTPLPGGNITEALYIDEDCTQRSTMSFYDYIVKWYVNYYYDQEKGEKVAQSWEANTERWNDLMMDYHVCQPCRAYNKVQMYEDEDRFRLRHLYEDDGGGDEEKWGYNCYDDAGYRNCNQCYKFESKTDMEPASIDDLERASKQGSILAIKVDGVTYGRGGIDWHDVEVEVQATLWILGTAAVLGIMWSVDKYYAASSRPRKWRRHFQKSLRVDFLDDATHAMTPEENSWATEAEELERRRRSRANEAEELARNRRIIEDQRSEIEQMKLELDQEHAIRGVEWEMNHRRQPDGEGGIEDQHPECQSTVLMADPSPPTLEQKTPGSNTESEQLEAHEEKKPGCSTVETNGESSGTDQGKEGSTTNESPEAKGEEGKGRKEELPNFHKLKKTERTEKVERNLTKDEEKEPHEEENGKKKESASDQAMLEPKNCEKEIKTKNKREPDRLIASLQKEHLDQELDEVDSFKDEP